MKNQHSYNIGDLLYIIKSLSNNTSRRVIIHNKKLFYNKILKKDEYYYQVRLCYEDTPDRKRYIDTEVYDPQKENIYGVNHENGWIPESELCSVYEIGEYSIPLCTKNSCEIIYSFLENDEYVFDKYILEKELNKVKKDLKKNKALLKAVKLLIEEYNYLETTLYPIQSNLEDYIYKLQMRTISINNELFV